MIKQQDTTNTVVASTLAMIRFSSNKCPWLGIELRKSFILLKNTQCVKGCTIKVTHDNAMKLPASILVSNS
jgi:hypothetical protein